MPQVEQDQPAEQKQTTGSDGTNADKPVISGLLYGVTDKPPLGIAVLNAFQIILYSIGSAVSMAFMVHMAVCAEGQSHVLVNLISTSLFFCGFTTLLQVTFGLRLPVTQGSSTTFLIPILVMMKTDRWRCPAVASIGTENSNGNMTAPDLEDLEPWTSRIAEISGCLAVASCTQITLGMTGLIGVIVPYIGPLTVAPLLSLLAVYLGRVVVYTSQAQWGISLLMVFLTVVFTVAFAKVQVPCFSWNRKKGFHIIRIQAFRIFATIFALGICWLLCLILTSTDVFPNDPTSSSYKARTDAKLDALMRAPWIFFPYPGKWGPLTVGTVTTTGMLAAVLASVIESLGDYEVTAQICQVPPPPRHAINRAVLIEGVGSLLSGLFGACHATTSYSNIIGYVSYTGVASRLSWQVAGVIFMFASVFGKIGGLLALVPEPVVGGMLLVSCGMVFSSGVAALRPVNLQLPRNLMTLGVSIMIGAAIPFYVENSPQALYYDKTGVLEVFLTNGPLLGALVGFFMDNLLPGSREDRGLVSMETSKQKNFSLEGNCRQDRTGPEVYEFNYSFTKNVAWPSILQYIPFSPLFGNGGESGLGERLRKWRNARSTKHNGQNGNV